MLLLGLRTFFLTYFNTLADMDEIYLCEQSVNWILLNNDIAEERSTCSSYLIVSVRCNTLQYLCAYSKDKKPPLETRTKFCSFPILNEHRCCYRFWSCKDKFRALVLLSLKDTISVILHISLLLKCLHYSVLLRSIRKITFKI